MIYQQTSSTVPETIKSANHKFQNFEKSRHALFSKSVNAQSKHGFGLEETTPSNNLLLKEMVSTYWIHQKENMRIHRGEKGRKKELYISAANG